MNIVFRQISLFILLLGSLVVNGQSSVSTDNGEKYALTYKIQLHIDSLCRASTQIRFTSPDTAIDIAEEALEMAQKYNYDEGEAKAFTSLGDVFWIKSGYIRSFDYLFQALKIWERVGKRKASASLLDKIGLMFESRGMLGKGFENFEKALAIYKEIGDDEGLAETMSYMGNNLSQQQRHEKALDLLLKSLKVRQYLGNKKEISRSLNTLGIAYDRHGELDKALEYFERSLAIKQDIKDFRGAGYNLNYMADIYVKKEDYNKSIELYKKSIYYKELMKDNYGKLFSLLGLAKVYDKKGFYPAGVINYGLQSYQLAKQLNSIDEMKESATLLAKVYEYREAYQQALFFQKVVNECSDLVNDDANIKELEALKYRYEMDRKNTENELLRKNNLLRQQKLQANQIELEQKKNTIFIISIILTSLVLMLFVLFKYSTAKRKANLAIQKVNEELEQKVAERTAQLQTQNEKLVEYAFFNAHKVRGPLARILGLINLMKMEFDDEKTTKFTHMIEKSATELNDVVAEINRILDEEGLPHN